MPARFNHMELTLPHRSASATAAARSPTSIQDMFGWDSMDVPILGQVGLLLRTDPDTSQFILVTEQNKHSRARATTISGFSTTPAPKSTSCSRRRRSGASAIRGSRSRNTRISSRAPT